MTDVTESIQRAGVGDGIELAYEHFGDPTEPPLLLVMGLGAQMLRWDDEFCAALAARGLFVVRFDNRDVGLSTHLHDAPRAEPSRPRRRATRLRRPTRCPTWRATPPGCSTRSSSSARTSSARRWAA